MIVAVHYQFHDYEPRSQFWDIGKLAPVANEVKGTLFESEVRMALASAVGDGRTYVFLDGNRYLDQWGILADENPACQVHPPVVVEGIVHLKVNFEDGE
jgi:hypothetical protein